QLWFLKYQELLGHHQHGIIPLFLHMQPAKQALNQQLVAQHFFNRNNFPQTQEHSRPSCDAFALSPLLTQVTDSVCDLTPIRQFFDTGAIRQWLRQNIPIGHSLWEEYVNSEDITKPAGTFEEVKQGLRQAFITWNHTHGGQVIPGEIHTNFIRLE